ncbi:DNA alkylation repair protein [Pseudoalteromonas sp. G4]|uniref:DNA alkylation repair protein n=1 Tax=Pseudoalteromonas sp. G4 TaxID=2992761 RepID=UPI00237DF8B0|nr:DNA alkylation repair protein [Pseudoalteromonas sp. G4]MDE3273036.1 DNA alkylation repair protein [Pseudoalteromonas sp. G4]
MISLPSFTKATIPDAPRAIAKGSSLADLLNDNAIYYLARNIEIVHSDFDSEAFVKECLNAPEGLALMAKGQFIAKVLHQFLPPNYQAAINILTQTLINADESSEEFGLAGFFYLPHSFYIAQYGLDAKYNDGIDPFDISMKAQYELTQRFSAEFCIRPFLIEQQARTLETLKDWQFDRNRHIRRLVSEGTRPKLPWGKRLPDIIKDPMPILPLLTHLKDDSSLYVRRSVANSLGDIAKDHPSLVFDLLERWLEGANAELKWLIRHAVRYYAKKNVERALAIRIAAK